MKKNKSIFPKDFDHLQSDFARARLRLDFPFDLSKQINRNRWGLYVSSLELRQLVDEFAKGIDDLNGLIRNAPYVYDFADGSEGKKAKIYSYTLAAESMAQEVCKRLKTDGSFGKMSRAARMAAACHALSEFDNDEEDTRKAWIERYAKANLLNQNASFINLQNRFEWNPKLLKRSAKFIEP